MQQNKTLTRGVRYHLLDMLRGVGIIYVVFFHAVFNLSSISLGAYKLLHSRGMEISQFIFVGMLILISGICTRLTRSNLKRGIKTTLAALLVTAVTAVIEPDMTIIFGILHFFGVAMLIYAALGKLIDKIPSYIGIPLFTLLWIFTYNIYSCAPKMPKSIILFILGFNTGHISGDYYPLMPHLFLFLVGAFVGRIFTSGKAPRCFTLNPIPPLSFIGRHTLFIYLIHQPILYAITWLISVFGG